MSFKSTLIVCTLLGCIAYSIAHECYIANGFFVALAWFVYFSDPI